MLADPACRCEKQIFCGLLTDGEPLFQQSLGYDYCLMLTRPALMVLLFSSIAV